MSQPENPITVVIQGPVFGSPRDEPSKQLTARVIASVRNTLPGAELILSTWKSSAENASNLDCDILQLSDDPGGHPISTDGKFFSNVNRQIVSTKEGLKRASRPFAVKLRSDMMLVHTNFLNYFAKYNERNPALKILERRIVASTVHTPSPLKGHGYLYFHLSDWFHFGLREDLLKVWDIPLAPEPETSNWFLSYPKPEHYPFGKNFHHRYAPEQYIWLTFLNQFFKIDYRSIGEVGGDLLAMSILSIVNNSVLVEPEEIGLQTLKFPLPADRPNAFSHDEWLTCYKQLCCS